MAKNSSTAIVSMFAHHTIQEMKKETVKNLYAQFTKDLIVMVAAKIVRIIKSRMLWIKPDVPQTITVDLKSDGFLSKRVTVMSDVNVMDLSTLMTEENAKNVQTSSQAVENVHKLIIQDLESALLKSGRHHKS